MTHQRSVLLIVILVLSALLAGLATPAAARSSLWLGEQPENDRLAALQGNRCTPDQPGCQAYHRFVQGICIPGFFFTNPGPPWILGPCPGQVEPTATNTEIPQPTATNTPIQTEPPEQTEPPVLTDTPSSTEDPGGEATRVILPTPRPDPGRQQPGGPGNLGLVVSGVMLGASLLGLSGFLLYRRMNLK